MRQIVLDTETTGLEPAQGHRIIEIGCVEIKNRRKTDRTFHQYLNPQREIDDGAFEVHGISNEFLHDKPLFRDIVREFIDFIRDAEVIIHNAPFDVEFFNAELQRLGPEWGRLQDHCRILDTLVLARERHPGQKNNLDALCSRYQVDNSARDLHGALLDAQILLDVYLAMTGGQATLSLGSGGEPEKQAVSRISRLEANRPPLRVIRPSAAELVDHQKRLETINKESGGRCRWYNSEDS